KVIPDLAKDNHVVILDRYIDSSLAYQGIARGLGFDTVLELHSYFPLTLRPDLTFYLKIDLETSLKRQDTRGNEKDYFEKEAHVFYQNLIDGYNQSASKFTRRIKSINAQNTIETVSNDLSDTWVQFLKGN
ncbi:MAG: dTMP kinase, partial [Thermoproteota archaeon]